MSTNAIVAKLFRSTSKRVRDILGESGGYGDALQRVHKHDPNADMGDKLKELGQLMIELKRFRESVEYEEVEKDSKLKSDTAIAWRQKKKEAESSTMSNDDDFLDMSTSEMNELERKKAADNNARANRASARASKRDSSKTANAKSANTGVQKQKRPSSSKPGSRRTKAKKAAPSPAAPPPVARSRPSYASADTRYDSLLDEYEADQRAERPGLRPLNINDNDHEDSDAEAKIDSSSSDESDGEEYNTIVWAKRTFECSTIHKRNASAAL